MPKMQKGGWIRRIAAGILSFFAGAVNALFGGGGGLLIVPALGMTLGVEEKRAHATSIAVMLPLSICSAFVFSVRGTWDPALALQVTSGAAVGAVFGVLILKKIPKGVLTIVFDLLMVYAGIMYLK